MAAGIKAGTAYVDILPNLAGFVGGVQRGLAPLGKQLRTTGAAMTRGLTLPLVGAGIGITKLSLSFSDALTNIRALVGASDKQVAQYRQGILALAGETTKGPTELAESLYFLASAGFEGKKALDVLRAAARASSSGLGETQQVAQLVGAAVNAYGEKALSAAHATDVLVATVREGTAEPAELAGALGRVIAPAQAVGVSFDQVGGAVAGLTLTGLDAAESVTALRGILVSFLKPSKQGEEALKEFGLSTNFIAENLKSKGLLPTLQELRDTFGDNNKAIAKVFPNVRALNGFLALTGQNAKKNQAAMEAVTHSTGDMDKAFTKASESVGFKMRNAFARLQVSAITIGDILLPIIADVADKLAGWAKKIQELSPWQQKLIVWAGLVAAALGPVVFVLGSLFTAISTVTKSLIVLEKTAAGATKFRAGWLAALATNPWVLAAAAVTALGVGLYVLNQRAGASEQAIKDLTDATNEFAAASGALNASSNELKHARLDETAAEIAATQARRNYTAVMKNENHTTLEAKAARNALEQANLAFADAQERTTKATNDNRVAQQKQRETLVKAKTELALLNDRLNEVRKGTVATGRAAGTAEQRQARWLATLTPKLVYEYADALVLNAQAYGATAKQAKASREDIAKFIETQGRIPTEKELKLIVTANGHDISWLPEQLARSKEGIDALYDKTVTITYEQRGTTGRGPAEGSNAAGTDYFPGGLTWVGERGRELLNLPRGSQIIPNSKATKVAAQGGGRQRLTITNWDEGTGFIETIADDSVDLADGNNQTLARMRGRS